MLRTQWQAASLLIGASIAVACGDPQPGGEHLDATARAPDGGAGGDSGSSPPPGGPDAGAACEADDECDDGSPCNGPERCVRGRCASSRPLTDGTVCDQDGIPNTYDVCMAGFCVDSRCGDGHVDERPGETCDD